MAGETEQFVVAEYNHAANAYFKGVDIGFRFVQILLVVNALLVAAASAIAQSDLAEPTSNLAMRIIAVVGLLPSGVLLAILGNYEMQLANCLARCAQIETTFGGKFFSDLKSISEDKHRTVTTTGAMRFMAFASAAAWVVVLIDPGLLQAVAKFLSTT